MHRSQPLPPCSSSRQRSSSPRSSYRVRDQVCRQRGSESPFGEEICCRTMPGRLSLLAHDNSAKVCVAERLCGGRLDGKAREESVGLSDFCLAEAISCGSQLRRAGTRPVERFLPDAASLRPRAASGVVPAAPQVSDDTQGPQRPIKGGLRSTHFLQPHSQQPASHSYSQLPTLPHPTQPPTHSNTMACPCASTGSAADCNCEKGNCQCSAAECSCSGW